MKPIDENKVSQTVELSCATSMAPSELVQALQSPLASELTRWEFCALVCFLRHERRQQWVSYVVKSRLNCNGAELGTLGSIGHPQEIPQEGEVPGEPGWRYYFHGCGCCLTSADGTRIDVDFAKDGSPLEIDPYFYSWYLQSLPKADWCEAQLKREAPFQHVWQFDLDRLQELQLISRNWRFQLTDAGRAFAETLEPLVDGVEELSCLEDRDSRWRLCWLLLKLGDVIGAARVAEQAGLSDAKHLAAAAQAELDQRAASLWSRMQSPDATQRRRALEALTSLGRHYVEQDVRAMLLQQPASGDNHFALDVINDWNDASLDPLLVEAVKAFGQRSRLRELWRRFVTAEPDEQRRPRLGLLVKLCRTLLSRHSPATLPAAWSSLLQGALRQDCFACDAEAGMLLHLFDRKAGIAKLANNLRHPIPITREEAAVFLGIIASDDAVDILCRAATGPAAQSHEAACVLALLPHEQAARAAESWHRQHKGYEEAVGRPTEIAGRTVRTWTFDEISRVNMRTDIEYQYEKLGAEFRPLIAIWRSH